MSVTKEEEEGGEVITSMLHRFASSFSSDAILYLFWH